MSAPVTQATTGKLSYTPGEGVLLKVPQLPTTTEALRDSRKLKKKRTINDQVEDFVVKHWEDKGYRKFVDAIYESEAAEGSFDIDDVMAAQFIRAAANKAGNGEVASAKLDTIVQAMKTVLRRYQQSRQERRDGTHVSSTRVSPEVDGNAH